MEIKKKNNTSANILLLGMVSFFSDVSTDMVYPLIPLYLSGAFGVTPVIIGLIEGIAESLASLLKVFSGYLSDKYHKKKRLAFLGYGGGLIYKILLLMATSWVGVLLARVIDKIGKGIRTSPRDVLIAESADKQNMGKAYGIHKALDMAGSALGILLSYFILLSIGDSLTSYRDLFVVAIIPAAIGLVIMGFVREKPHQPLKEREPFWRNLHQVSPNLKRYLFISLLFTLGNSSNTFLLLRAKAFGFNDTNVILLYFIYNLSAAILSVPFGKHSDKIGRKRPLVIAYFLFGLVYLGFGFAQSRIMLIATFVLYGVFTALNSGAERAFIAEVSPSELKGTMLGMQATLTGLGLLPASIIAGLLWDNVAYWAPFAFGATMAFLAGLLLLTTFKKVTNNN